MDNGTEPRVLVQFNDDWYYGNVEGLFIATQAEYDQIMKVGPSVYLGEICGKHSEVRVEELNEKNCKLISKDQALIEQLEAAFGSVNLSGINPFDSVEEDDLKEESSDEEE